MARRRILEESYSAVCDALSHHVYARKYAGMREGARAFVREAKSSLAGTDEGLMKVVGPALEMVRVALRNGCGNPSFRDYSVRRHVRADKHAAEDRAGLDFCMHGVDRTRDVRRPRALETVPALAQALRACGHMAAAELLSRGGEGAILLCTRDGTLVVRRMDPGCVRALVNLARSSRDVADAIVCCASGSPVRIASIVMYRVCGEPPPPDRGHVVFGVMDVSFLRDSSARARLVDALVRPLTTLVSGPASSFAVQVDAAGLLSISTYSSEFMSRASTILESVISRLYCCPRGHFATSLTAAGHTYSTKHYVSPYARPVDYRLATDP
jgi:hypothetical protein